MRFVGDRVCQTTYMYDVTRARQGLFFFSMLTNCLAACAHLSITVSEIQRDIREKSAIFHTPLYPTPPLGGFPSEYRHPLWYEKTRMVSLPDCEKKLKISLFVLAQLRNVTDRQTDGHRVTAYTALMHMHRAVKMTECRLLVSLYY